MRSQKNETPQHRVIIDANGKSYRLNIGELSIFLESCEESISGFQTESLSTEIQTLTDFVIDGAQEELPFIEIKRSLKLLRDLNYLFMGLLSEVKN